MYMVSLEVSSLYTSNVWCPKILLEGGMNSYLYNGILLAPSLRCFVAPTATFKKRQYLRYTSYLDILMFGYSFALTNSWQRKYKVAWFDLNWVNQFYKSIKHNFKIDPIFYSLLHISVCINLIFFQLLSPQRMLYFTPIPTSLLLTLLWWRLLGRIVPELWLMIVYRRNNTKYSSFMVWIFFFNWWNFQQNEIPNNELCPQK